MRGHNQGANSDEEDAQGREEGGGRRKEKKVQIKIQDSHSRGNNTASQHLLAVTSQNLVPSGPLNLGPFRTTMISQGKHLQQDPELGLTDEEVAAEVANCLKRIRSSTNRLRPLWIPFTGSMGTLYQSQI